MLPDPHLKGPLHDSVGILRQVHRFRKNLFDHPIQDTEVFGTQMVGDSYKTKYVVEAVVSDSGPAWVLAQPTGISAQSAELIFQTKVLNLAGTSKSTFTLIANMP